MNLSLPIFAFVYLKKHFEKLEEAVFEQKFGTLYSNHNTRRTTIIVSMPIFCLKRLLVAFGTVFVIQPLAFNIMVYIYISIFSLGFNLTVRPLNTRALNLIDNINESFILISSYFMMAFSAWIYTPNKNYHA